MGAVHSVDEWEYQVMLKVVKVESFQKCESLKNVEAGGIENYLALELCHTLIPSP